jgi:hypothetical protein
MRDSFRYPNADVSAVSFIPLLAKLAGQFAFITPTETGLHKSIMDATEGVRYFLKSEGLHDYESQGQGPQNKVTLPAFFVTAEKNIPSKASLYRPVTKHGDPRIWFSGLGTYASANQLLGLITFDGAIYVLNLSDQSVVNSLKNNGHAAQICFTSRTKQDEIKNELLNKIQKIHDQGWLPSITPGDPGVGDTLENALGISRNNSEKPDYKGIELKATRITRHGAKKAETRSTLFTRVPDEGLTYHEILDHYGKVQTPRGFPAPRLQLYETVSAARVDAYDLYLSVDSDGDTVNLVYSSDGTKNPAHSRVVSKWSLNNLRDALKTKHNETFWIGAESKDIKGKEYFRYDVLLHTQKPNAAILSDLIADGTITVDLAVHCDPLTHKYRDHGMLWKIWKEDLPLVLGESEVFVLEPGEKDLFNF